MDTSDEEFLRDLLAAFQAEADEHLQVLATGLLDLESSADDEDRRRLIEQIYREAHSLKGAARAVNMSEIETVCQALESTFSAWKRQPLQASPAAFDLLQRALGMIEALLAAQFRAQPAPDRRQMMEVVQKLGMLEAERRPAVPSPPPADGPTGEARAGFGEKSSPVPAATTQAPSSDTVRISIARLEDLLGQVEELLLLKQNAIRLADDMRRIQQSISRWARARTAMQVSGDGYSLPMDGNDLRGSSGERPVWNGDATPQGLSSQSTAVARAAEHDAREMSARIDRIVEDAKTLLLQPFSTLLAGFPRMVRDLGREQGKQVRLELRGGDVEIDKRILEALKDPLIHVIRNSVGHGVEPPDVRERSGKDPTATVTIAVSRPGGSEVEVRVSDDGSGIDIARVKASSVQLGIVAEEEARRMDDAEAARLIFHSDVSTSPLVTDISGRGLGMAIVREKVEKLGGRVMLATAMGQGTTFSLILPLTLATFKGIVVRAGDQTVVLPTSDVERVLRVHESDIQTVENRPMIGVDGRLLPIVSLQDLLGLPSVEPAAGNEPPWPVVVIGGTDRRIGLRVQEVFHEQEVLVKALPRPLVRVRHIAGATTLSSGKPAAILHVADLLTSATTAEPAPIRAADTAETKSVNRMVLVAEDSITSRMLLKGILESAGYQVTTAVDGADALAALNKATYGLVVSDVDMPRLDGFQLTQRIRADPKLSGIPVVLVTARDTQADRQRGVQAGATAYLVKSSFDQSNLLTTVKSLI